MWTPGWCSSSRSPRTWPERALLPLLLLLYTHTCASSAAYGNTYEDVSVQWAVQSTGASATANSVAIDPYTSTAYITGSFNGTLTLGADVLSSGGGTDALIWVVASDGSVMGGYSMGGRGNDVGRSIALNTNAGDIYVVGTFEGDTMFGKSVLNATGAQDWFVAKVSDGVKWAKSFGGAGDDIAYDVAVSTDDSAIYVVGSFSGSVKVNGSTYNATGGSGRDAMLLKLSTSDGSVLWARTYGSVGEDEACGVAVVSDTTTGTEAVYVGGYHSGEVVYMDANATTHVVMNHTGGMDVTVLKFNATGDVVWARAYGGTQDDRVNAVAATSDAVYLAGTFQGSWALDTKYLQYVYTTTQGMLVVKLDGATGDSSYAKGFGGTDKYDTAQSIAVDSAGQAYFTGIFRSSYMYLSSIALYNGGGSDLLLAKLSTTGSVLYAVSIAGSGDDAGLSIALDRYRAPVVVGSFNSSTLGVSSGVPSLVGSGSGEDMLVVKASGTICYDSPVTIGIDATRLNAVLTTWASQGCEGYISFTSASAVLQLNDTYTLTGTLVLDATGLHDYVTLKAAPSQRHFNVTSGGNLTASFVKFSDGYIFDEISANGGSVKFASGSAGVFSSCVWSNNTAYARGNGTRTNSSAKGGAVYIDPYGTDVSLATCVFSGNEAIATYSAQGGAVYQGYMAYMYDTYLTIEGCTFTSNRAVVTGADAMEAQGGAVFSAAGTVVVTFNQFTSNEATMSGAIAANDTVVCGGAVMAGYMNGLTMYFNTFWSNQASLTLLDGTAGLYHSVSGGALCVREMQYTMVIANSSFMENTASVKVYNESYSGQVKALGGAVHSYYTQISYAVCIFTSNTALVSGWQSSYVQGVSLAAGGAVYSEYYTSNYAVDVYACSFQGNTAEAPLQAYGGAWVARDLSYTLTMNGNAFSGNIAKLTTTSKTTSASGSLKGGAVYLTTVNWAALTHSYFSGNYLTGAPATRAGVTSYGGAVYLESTYTSIEESYFASNRIDHSPSTYRKGSAVGGAVYAMDSGATISNSSFEANEAYSTVEAGGGAVYQQGSTSGSASMTMTLTNFAYNQATCNSTKGMCVAKAGALKMASYADSSFYYVQFDHNTARAVTYANANYSLSSKGDDRGYTNQAYAGALYLDSSTVGRVQLDHCNFTANTVRTYNAKASAAGALAGAAIFESTKINLTNAMFLSNGAVVEGKAVAMYTAIGAVAFLELHASSADYLMFESNYVRADNTSAEAMVAPAVYMEQPARSNSSKDLYFKMTYTWVSGTMVQGALASYDVYAENYATFHCDYVDVSFSTTNITCSAIPTRPPTLTPTVSPTNATTNATTLAPTIFPTNATTMNATHTPTKSPSNATTLAPTTNATTLAPTVSHTNATALAPTMPPTNAPTSYKVSLQNCTGSPASVTTDANLAHYLNAWSTWSNQSSCHGTIYLLQAITYNISVQYTFSSGQSIVLDGSKHAPSSPTIKHRGSGNALYIGTGSSLTAKYVEFTNAGDSAVYVKGNATFTNCRFRSNGATYSLGGAISNNCGFLKTVSCTFTSNTAYTGGAVYASANGNCASATYIQSCTFEKNNAEINGGAIKADSTKSVLVNNTRFSSNTAGEKGGALAAATANVYVYGSTFYGNQAGTSAGAAYGSYSYTGKWVIKNCTFTRNHAWGGNGGAVLTEYLSMAIVNSRFISNRASGYGGGCAVTDETTGKLVVNGTYFRNNTASTGAGGEALAVAATSSMYRVGLYRNTYVASEEHGKSDVYMGSSTSPMACTAASASAQPNITSNKTTYTCSGGTTTTSASSFTTTNCTGSPASASTDSALAYYLSKWSNQSSCYGHVYLTMATTYNITAAYTFSMKQRIVIDGSKVAPSVPLIKQKTGGAHHFSVGSGTSLQMKYVEITGASETAVAVLQGNATFTSCRFTSNGASFSYGGAVSNNCGYVKASSCTFKSNTASVGGAVYVYGTGCTATSGTSIKGSAFEKNSAGSEGGAIRSYDASISIDKSTFTSNTAGTSGGAIYGSTSTYKITNTRFTSNRATTSGGAAFAYYAYSSTKWSMSNCTLTRNQAVGGGGGAVVGQSLSMVMTESKFVSNRAGSYGGACAVIGADSGRFDVNGTTFYNNTARTGAGGEALAITAMSSAYPIRLYRNTYVASEEHGKSDVYMGWSTAPMACTAADTSAQPNITSAQTTYTCSGGTSTTSSPTKSPTLLPTHAPTMGPTTTPSLSPTIVPTKSSTGSPTTAPPTVVPTSAPTEVPKSPLLLKLNVTSTAATSITLTAKLSKSGYIYCAAFGSAATRTGSQVKAAAYGHNVTANNAYALTISGLTPLTKYTTYCYTEDLSSPANQMPDWLVSRTSKNATTTCCYSMTMPTLPTGLYSKTTSSALSVTAPYTSPNITLRITTHWHPSTATATCTSSPSLLPTRTANHTFNATVTPRVLTFKTWATAAFTFTVPKAGCYVLNYTVEGSKKATFYKPAVQGIYVLSKGEAAPGPSLTSAYFTSSGAQMTLGFSADTNKAGKSGEFGCSQVVTFTGGSSATCSWSTASALLATLPSTATIVPGDNVTLVANTVKAACPSSTNCTSWPYSAVGSKVAVQRPTSPLLPTPVVAYSTKVSTCADLSVDASRSSGSGGRDMEYVWSASSSDVATIANITKYITTTANTGKGLSVIKISSSYLSVGTLTLSLSLKNFLGGTASTGSMAITIAAGGGLPSVSVVPSTISMYRSQTLSLYAEALLPSCAYPKKLSYKWSGPSTSTSADPRYYRLAANTLAAGTSYTVKVNATGPGNMTNTATATITVLRSALVASIVGGTTAVQGSDRAIALDASKSYDPDDSSAKLNHTWTCTRGGSSYGQSCGASLSAQSKISVGPVSAGEYIFTVTVNGAGSRAASASKSVTVIQGSAPLVSIRPLTVNASRVSPSNRLSLSASVTANGSSLIASTFNVSFTWSVASGALSGGASLANAASGALYGVYQGRRSASLTVPASIVLASDSLVRSSSYVLRLSATQQSAGMASTTAYAELSFKTAGPPTSGTLTLSPASGRALQTLFTFTMANWVDDPDDYPFSYSYYYVRHGETTEVPLLVSTTLASTSSYLPEGGGSLKNLTGVAYVSDAYGASTRTTFSPLNVHAVSVSLSTLASNVSSLLSSAAATSNLDQILQVTMAASSALSSSSCNSSSSSHSKCADVRSTLLTFLGSAVSSSSSASVSAEALDQQSQALEGVTSEPDQLKPAAKAQAVDLVSSVASAGAATGLKESTVTSLGNIISSLITDNATAQSSLGTKLSESVDHLVEGSWAGLMAAEGARTVVTSNLQLTASVDYASLLTNKTLKPVNGSGTIVLPSSLSSVTNADGEEATIGVAVSSMPGLRVGQTTKLTSNLVRLSVSQRDGGGGVGGGRRRGRTLLVEQVLNSAKVEIDQKHVKPSKVTYSTVYLNCSAGETASKAYTCPGTTTSHSITCTGAKSSRTVTCASGNTTTCGVYDATSKAFSDATCSLVSKGSDGKLSCVCSSLASYDNSHTANSLVVDIAGMSKTVAADFVSTLRIAETLNLRVIGRNIVVFVAMASILLASVMLCFGGYRRDVRDREARARALIKAKHDAEHTDDAAAKTAARLEQEKLEMDDVDDEGEEVLSATGAQLHERLTKQEAKVVTMSLPGFVTVVGDYWRQLIHEMGRRHDWFSIVTVYSAKYSRPFRIALVTTTTLTLMFINAVLYSLMNPTNTCTPLDGDPAACLTQTAQYSTEPICQYDFDQGKCLYTDATNEVTTQLAVAIISNMISAPLTMLLTLVFTFMLLPPTRITDLQWRDVPEHARRVSAKYMLDNMGDSGSKVDKDSLRQVQARTRRGWLWWGHHPAAPKRIYTESPTQEFGAQEPRTLLAQDKVPWSVRMKKALDSVSPFHRKSAEEQLARAQERAQFEEFVDAETAKVLSSAQQQHAELRAAIDAARATAAAANGSTEQKAAYTRLEALVKYRRKHEATYGLDAAGQLRRETAWENLIRRGPVKRVRKRVKRDLVMARRLEQALHKLPPLHREIRLMEYQRLDTMTNAERKIYLRNMKEFKTDDKDLDPVSRGWKASGWAIVVAVNLFFAFYILLFGISKGAKTTNSWLLSFIVSTAQDPLLNSPLLILFFNVLLPMYIADKIARNLDGSGDTPIIFKAFIASGPACRVAMKHPQWVTSKLINKVLAKDDAPLDPSATQAIVPSGAIASPSAKAPLSPVSTSLSASASGSGYVEPITPTAATGVRNSVVAREFQNNANAHFREAHKRAPRLPLVLVLLAPLVWTLLMLPGKLMDVIVQDIVGAVTGGGMVGYFALEKIKKFVGVGLLMCFLFTLIVIIVYQVWRHRNRKRRVKHAVAPAEPSATTPLPQRPTELIVEDIDDASTASNRHKGGSGGGPSAASAPHSPRVEHGHHPHQAAAGSPADQEGLSDLDVLNAQNWDTLQGGAMSTARGKLGSTDSGRRVSAQSQSQLQLQTTSGGGGGGGGSLEGTPRRQSAREKARDLQEQRRQSLLGSSTGAAALGDAGEVDTVILGGTSSTPRTPPPPPVDVRGMPGWWAPEAEGATGGAGGSGRRQSVREQQQSAEIDPSSPAGLGDTALLRRSTKREPLPPLTKTDKKSP